MHTIVVIEDQSVLASIYRNKFQSEGFSVEVALDGELGLDLITRGKT
jgi:DNA-binding response OmpR family regulator